MTISFPQAFIRMIPHLYGPGFSTLTRSVRLFALERQIALTHGLVVAGQWVPPWGERHRRWHPFAQFPVLLDGTARLFETLAICRHLDGHRSSISPEVEAWSCALLTTVDRRLVRDYLLPLAGPQPEPTFTGERRHQAEHQVAATLQRLEERLGQQSFLCGSNFTLADALLAPMLDYLERLPYSWLVPYPQLARYLSRLRQRPAGQAVLVAPDFSSS